MLNIIEALAAENAALRLEVQQLRDENARLKRLLADAVLDNAMLKEIASKKF